MAIDLSNLGVFAKIAPAEGSSGKDIVHIVGQDKVMLGGKYRTCNLIGRWGRGEDSQIRNNISRAKFLVALGKTLGVDGMEEDASGNVRFSDDFLEKLKQTLDGDNENVLGIQDFKIKDGKVTSGRPLTERRVRQIVDMVRAKAAHEASQLDLGSVRMPIAGVIAEQNQLVSEKYRLVFSQDNREELRLTLKSLVGGNLTMEQNREINHVLNDLLDGCANSGNAVQFEKGILRFNHLVREICKVPGNVTTSVTADMIAKVLTGRQKLADFHRLSSLDKLDFAVNEANAEILHAMKAAGDKTAEWLANAMDNQPNVVKDLCAALRKMSVKHHQDELFSMIVGKFSETIDTSTLATLFAAKIAECEDRLGVDHKIGPNPSDLWNLIFGDEVAAPKGLDNLNPKKLTSSFHRGVRDLIRAKWPNSAKLKEELLDGTLEIKIDNLAALITENNVPFNTAFKMVTEQADKISLNDLYMDRLYDPAMAKKSDMDAVYEQMKKDFRREGVVCKFGDEPVISYRRKEYGEGEHTEFVTKFTNFVKQMPPVQQKVIGFGITQAGLVLAGQCGYDKRGTLTHELTFVDDSKVKLVITMTDKDGKPPLTYAYEIDSDGNSKLVNFEVVQKIVNDPANGVVADDLVVNPNEAPHDDRRPIDISEKAVGLLKGQLKPDSYNHEGDFFYTGAEYYIYDLNLGPQDIERGRTIIYKIMQKGAVAMSAFLRENHIVELSREAVRAYLDVAQDANNETASLVGKMLSMAKDWAPGTKKNFFYSGFLQELSFAINLMPEDDPMAKSVMLAVRDKIYDIIGVPLPHDEITEVKQDVPIKQRPHVPTMSKLEFDKLQQEFDNVKPNDSAAVKKFIDGAMNDPELKRLFDEYDRIDLKSDSSFNHEDQFDDYSFFINGVIQNGHKAQLDELPEGPLNEKATSYRFAFALKSQNIHAMTLAHIRSVMDDGSLSAEKALEKLSLREPNNEPTQDQIETFKTYLKFRPIFSSHLNYEQETIWGKLFSIFKALPASVTDIMTKGNVKRCAENLKPNVAGIAIVDMVIHIGEELGLLNDTWDDPEIFKYEYKSMTDETLNRCVTNQWNPDKDHNPDRENTDLAECALWLAAMQRDELRHHELSKADCNNLADQIGQGITLQTDDEALAKYAKARRSAHAPITLHGPYDATSSLRGLAPGNMVFLSVQNEEYNYGMSVYASCNEPCKLYLFDPCGGVWTGSANQIAVIMQERLKKEKLHENSPMIVSAQFLEPL